MRRDVRPGFAIIRVERDQIRAPKNMEEFENLCNGAISVLKVLWSREEALREVERLNSITVDPQSYYYCQYTRVEMM